MYNIERMKKIGESILYKICKSTKEIEGKIYTVFGIECEKIRIDDVSSDRIRVIRLVELANALSLSPVHIKDVVIVFLE